MKKRLEIAHFIYFVFKLSPYRYDPIATYFFNIWPFTTMIICVIAYFLPNAILS